MQPAPPDPDTSRPAPDPGAGGGMLGGGWAGDKAAAPGRRLDLLSLIPLLSIVALVGLVGLAFAIVQRSDDEQARIKLASDALWVEQTLRFQMTVDEDMLARIAHEAAGGVAAGDLDTRSRLHMAANPELMSVIWYDGAGARLRELPGRGAPGEDALIRLLARMDRPLSRPTYGDVQADGSVSLAMALPGAGGFVAATVSLPLLLNRHVPWWIAEQYAVAIETGDGQRIAARQRIATDAESPSHAISFDPPLRGTALRITAYDRPPPHRLLMVFAVIGSLALFSLLSLLVLARSAQQRRRAERRVRNETAFRRSMEESLPIGMRAKDLNGRILYVNPAFCKLVGYPSDELVGHAPPMPYWDPAQLPEALARQRTLAAAGRTGMEFETRFVARDGRRIEAKVYEAPLIDASGVHRGWMGSIIDVTDQNAAERRARQQDETLAHTGRLVSLGEMASTLAHELNQPLSAIASYSAGMGNLMQGGDVDSALLRQANEKLAHQAGRAGQIIRRIQDLVRKREVQFTDLDLSEVVTETLGFAHADARKHRVRLVPHLAPVPPVRADRILLEQVLLNLIRNGIEAMAERRSADTLDIRVRRDGDMALVEIEDHGAGIPADLAPHLFDAFVTTKPQGMGMGLKICRSIMELHRGRLSHRPGAAGGTIFTVALKLAGSEDG